MSATPTLLDGALKSGSAVLVYGHNPPTAELIAAAQARWTEHHLLDLRDVTAVSSNGALRREVAGKLSERPALVVLVGAEVPDAVRELLAEIVGGQLNLPGEVRRLDERTRLLVVSPVDEPHEGLRALFALCLPAARALDERR